MIFGTYPFQAKSQEHTIKNILYSRVKFDMSKRISTECKELISKMMNKDPESRINMFDILNHQWFSMTTEEINSSKIINSSSYLRLNFNENDRSSRIERSFGILSKASTKKLKDFIIEK